MSSLKALVEVREALADSVAVDAQVRLDELIFVIQREGVEYAQAFAAHAVAAGPAHNLGPAAPRALPTPVSAVIREIVWDALYASGGR